VFNFKKLFSKKNDGFYLQLEDEDATSKPAAKAKETAQPVTAPAAAQPISAPVAQPVAISAPVAVVTEVAPVALGTTTAPATGTAVDKKIAKAEEKAAEKAAKAAKRAAAKAETPKVFAAPASVSAPAPAAPVITNFATDYLIKPSSISGRRMPGANMKGFLDLARQVEKPKAFKAAASERKAEKQ
jgi:hypothetical protein